MLLDDDWKGRDCVINGVAVVIRLDWLVVIFCSVDTELDAENASDDDTGFVDAIVEL